jgi:hypothetical protein
MRLITNKDIERQGKMTDCYFNEYHKPCLKRDRCSQYEDLYYRHRKSQRSQTDLNGDLNNEIHK